MKDLFLTPRGDLVIENISDSNNRLEIGFVTSRSNALRLNFFIEDTYHNKLSKTSLALNFNINIPEENKELRMISGNQALEQAIKIRLASALGSIRGNTDMGSKLEALMHSFVDDASTTLELEKQIKLAIYDIVPNANVFINKPRTKYLDYSSSLSVTIIDQDKKYIISL